MLPAFIFSSNLSVVWQSVSGQTFRIQIVYFNIYKFKCYYSQTVGIMIDL